MTSDERLPEAPVARRSSAADRLFGRRIERPYGWMAEAGPRLDAYLEAENAHADRALAPLGGLRRELEAELAERGRAPGPPSPTLRRGTYEFRARAREDGHAAWFRRDAARGLDEPVLDLGELAAGRRYVELGLFEPSDDGERLAFSIDRLGDEQYTLAVLDLRADRSPDLRVERVSHAVWAADGETLFYTVRHAVPNRTGELHRLHVPSGAGELVRAEPDPATFLRLRRSADGAALLLDRIRSLSGRSPAAIETWRLSAERPGDRWTPVVAHCDGVEYEVDQAGPHLYLRVDDGQGFRLVRAPLADPSHWEELVPCRAGIALAGLHLLRGHAVLEEREHGLPQLSAVDLASGELQRLPHAEPAYALGVGQLGAGRRPVHEFDTGILRYRYSSPVTPPKLIDYDLGARRATVLWQARVPGFDPSRYEVRRLHAPAPDGTPIPVSLVRARGDDAPALVLDGYGAYGFPTDAAFDASLVSMLDRGVARAIAHVRGGSEHGPAWHRAARRATKPTAIADFLAVAEHLVAAGHASRDRLAIRGVSAGGVLVGAAANRRPELFAAVAALVPLADLLECQLDGDTMPFAVFERQEWGDPRAGPEELERLAGHCPTAGVTAQAYPAMYVTAALHDGQVRCWQPARYVATLRHEATGDAPVLLRCHMHAGHAGPSNAADARRELATLYAFLLDRLDRA